MAEVCGNLIVFSQFDRRFQANVFTGSPDHYFKVARLDRPLHVFVEDGEIVRRQDEIDALRLATLKLNLFKSSQDGIVRDDTREKVAHIELDNLRTRPTPRVLHAAGNLPDGAVHRLDRQLGIRKRRVGKPVAKRIESTLHTRFSGTVRIVVPRLPPVRPLLEREVVFNLPDGLGERDGQSSAGVRFAEKRLCNLSGAGRAGEPRLENRRDVPIRLVDGQRLSVHQHQHDGFACRMQSLQ